MDIDNRITAVLALRKAKRIVVFTEAMLTVGTPRLPTNDVS